MVLVKMYLWIDDERQPPGPGWEHAPTFDAATTCLALSQFHTVSLDHDLGERKSGYDVVKWMIENGRLPGRVILHTANPVGRNSMREALQAVGYKVGTTVHMGACQDCPTLIHSDV